MSFTANNNNQITFEDRLFTLTERERRFLEKSWAKSFAENLFPAIKEESFAVLYSDKASRPNTPVNIIIGSMILKEFLTLTDEELLEALLFDVRFQYALHTTSFEEQPLSDRTLSRFRERCTTYESETGIDLLKNCMNGLSSQIASFMGINPGLSRMDSLMVAANIKKLSRLELLYTCVANMVKCLQKNADQIPEDMAHYLEENDRNKVIYHARSADTDSRMEIVLKDAAVLSKLCASQYDETSEYQLLVRVIREQTTVNEDNTLVLKAKGDETLDSSILQNPSDPDATYRCKAGKQNRGYAANLTETVGEHGSVITDYDYDANIKSDSEFLKDKLTRDGKQAEEIILITDGAYGGEDNVTLASENNVRLVTTNMQGTKPEEVFANFEFSEDGKQVLRCAGGQVPLTSRPMASTDQCRITLDKEICNNCQYKEQCRPKFHKTKASKVLSHKTAARAKQLSYMKTEEFYELAKIRNGVESLPSILRRKYDVDHMPVRGKLQTKLYFGCKVAAVNFSKLFQFQRNQDSCDQIPAIC